MNSSGVVFPSAFSAIRLGKVTGTEKAPLPAFAVPEPSRSPPFQSTSTCRANVAIRSSQLVKEQISNDTAGRQPEPGWTAARPRLSCGRQPAGVGLQASGEGGAAPRSPHHSSRGSEYLSGHTRDRSDDGSSGARVDPRRNVRARDEGSPRVGAGSEGGRAASLARPFPEPCRGARHSVSPGWTLSREVSGRFSDALGLERRSGDARVDR